MCWILIFIQLNIFSLIIFYKGLHSLTSKVHTRKPREYKCYEMEMASCLSLLLHHLSAIPSFWDWPPKCSRLPRSVCFLFGAYRAPAASRSLLFHSPGTQRDPRVRRAKERQSSPGGPLQPITPAGPLSSGAHAVLIAHLPPHQASQSIQTYIGGSIVFWAVSSLCSFEKCFSKFFFRQRKTAMNVTLATSKVQELLVNIVYVSRYCIPTCHALNKIKTICLCLSFYWNDSNILKIYI